MNVWFGTDWGAPVCHSTPKVGVPVGEACIWCDESIAKDDSGVGMPLAEPIGKTGLRVSMTYYHVECWVRMLVGSTGHQLRLCPCFGGDYEGEPEGMSRRDAARAAWDLARRRAGDTGGHQTD